MLEAKFTSGVDEIEVSGLTQWDRGQVLNLTVPDGLPSTYQVHFTFKGSNKALNVPVFSTTQVPIPDELLTQPRDLIAYVYLIASDDSGETVKTIHLPVERRAKPEDYSELPQTFQERVDSLLMSINEKADSAVERATSAAQEASEAATAAQTAKEVSEDAAENSAASAESAAAAQAAAEEALEMVQEQSAHASTHATGGSDPITPEAIGAAPAYQYSDTDITAGTTALDTGKMYIVYV